MKKVLTFILSLCCSTAMMATDFTDVSVKVDGRNTTFNNGKLIVKIGSDGRVSSYLFNQGKELLGSSGIYFDYTTKEGNKGLSPSKVEIIKNTPEMCEVLYSATSGNTIWQQGYIMRKNVAGLYTYVIATGTKTSANEPIKEARVCTRTASTFLNGYVDWKMNGTIPSNQEMSVAEKEENTVQDATYYLADGSIYTKYNWGNYIERDTVHGLSDGYFGIWNIPVSYEWLNGGSERQELTVHATSKSPISIMMLQGGHFGGADMILKEGEKKIFGPFLIYSNLIMKPKFMGCVEDAKTMALAEQEQWPYQWFDNALYPKERGTVKGHLNVTTGQRNDSVRIVLALEKNLDPIQQSRGYQYWVDTDKNGDFTLKHVRPGTYQLYAYAKAGDVTDMLEVNDITVTAGEQNIGTIDWTPERYTDQLWVIGENNRRSDEFKLSNEPRAYGMWEKSVASLTYTIGSSTPEENWYYAQCKSGTWNIKFNLDKKYSGTASLTASLAGATNAGTTVTVKVNGSTKGTWKPGYNDAAIYRSAMQSGRWHLMNTKFPASSLKEGANTISLTMSGNGKNGGFLYDCVKLEVGEQVSASIQGVMDDTESAPKTRKVMIDGRMVIVTPHGSYTTTGIRIE